MLIEKMYSKKNISLRKILFWGKPGYDIKKNLGYSFTLLATVKFLSIVFKS